MKKIFCMFIALLMVISMAVPAYAVTPALDVPDMPEIPDLSDDVDFGIDFGSIIGGWFEENPVLPLTPTEPIEMPTEPAEPTEPVEKPPAPVGSGWFDWLRGWCWWGCM